MIEREYPVRASRCRGKYRHLAAKPLAERH